MKAITLLASFACAEDIHQLCKGVIITSKPKSVYSPPCKCHCHQKEFYQRPKTRQQPTDT